MMDTDNSGLVEFAEFVRVMLTKNEGQTNMIKHCLSRFKTGTFLNNFYVEGFNHLNIENEEETELKIEDVEELKENKMSQILAYTVEDFDFYLKVNYF